MALDINTVSDCLCTVVSLFCAAIVQHIEPRLSSSRQQLEESEAIYIVSKEDRAADCEATGKVANGVLTKCCKIFYFINTKLCNSLLTNEVKYFHRI